MNLKQLGILGIGTVVGLTVSAGLISTNANPNANINLITSEEAKEIILKKVPNGTFTEFSFDSDDKTPKYDSTVIKDNIEYEVDVDAKTGEVIKFEKEKISINKTSTNSSVSTNNATTTNNNSNNTANSSATNNNTASNTQNNTVNNANTKASTSLIGEAKAKQIMLDKVPGATFRTFYLDNDYTPEYEGELIKDNVEYDISVDAKTGKIIEFSQEALYDNDDRYDDDRYDDDYDYDYDDDDRYDD